MSMDYKWVDGYKNEIYTDDMIFEIDPKTKKIAALKDQTMVSGEGYSQFIRFQMPRYYDGVDLSTKNIQIIYITESGFSDVNEAVCVERNDEFLRFGWLVPPEASYDVGILSFSIEFVGENYVLKTRVTNVEVFDGLNGGEVVPKPTDSVWYIELQQKCEYVLNQAVQSAGTAEESALKVAEVEQKVMEFANSADQIKLDVDNIAKKTDDASERLKELEKNISGKISVVLMKENILISKRKPDTFYLRITETQTLQPGEENSLRVSSNMGIVAEDNISGMKFAPIMGLQVIEN